VTSVRPGPKGPIVAFEGIDGIEVAKNLSGCEILVPTDELPEGFEVPEEADDVVGMMVADEKRGLLGKVVDVIVTGANDVWVIEGAFGEVLVPVIEDVLVGYDDDSDTMLVRLLPGLIDEEAEGE
jgi:16S rRNA processing protein RimM